MRTQLQVHRHRPSARVTPRSRRFRPIFFGEDDPAPSSWIDRTLSKVAVALLERGTPLARVIDLVPIALIAAGIFLAL